MSNPAAVAAIRERVVRMYQFYAPDKINSVDNAMLKYQGQEEALVAALVTKYGPEPGANGLLPSASAAPRAASSGGAAAASAASGRASMASNGAPGAQTSGTFGPAGGSPGGGVTEDDEMHEIMKIINASGFVCAEDERRWEEAWLGRIPLNTICKDSGTTQVLLEGYGVKHTSRFRALQAWQKRYFVVVPPFVYYFENDNIDAPCRGAIYLPRAEINEVELSGRSAIEITPTVVRKPQQLDPHAEFGSFVIGFDAPRVSQMWFTVLQKLAAMNRAKQVTKAPSASAAMTTTPQPGALAQQQSMAAAAAMQQQQRATSPPNGAMVGPPGVGGRPAGGGGRPPAATLPISNDEMLRRVSRLAADRNSNEVVKVLMTWIGSIPMLEPLALWRLMESVEGLERVNANFGSGVFSDGQSMSGAAPGGAGGGQDLGGSAMRQQSMRMLDSQASFVASPRPTGVDAIEVAELRASQLAMERRFEEQFQALARAQANLSVAASAVGTVRQQGPAASAVQLSGSLATPGPGMADANSSSMHFSGGMTPGSRYPDAADNMAASPSSAAALSGDQEFLRRMERVRARKLTVDRMLSSIGGAPTATPTAAASPPPPTAASSATA